LAIRVRVRLAGTEFFPRAEPPSAERSLPPEEVEDRCMSEWERHLRVAMPVLAIHDLAQQIAELEADLDKAVREARAAGVAWTAIGEAAGIDEGLAKQRWPGIAP